MNCHASSGKDARTTPLASLAQRIERYVEGRKPLVGPQSLDAVVINNPLARVETRLLGGFPLPHGLYDEYRAAIDKVCLSPPGGPCCPHVIVAIQSCTDDRRVPNTPGNFE